MQNARQHTRFFRLVYYSPKQSDILCGIDVRIHIATAKIALERLVASYTDMVASVTSLRSIFRLNYNPCTNIYEYVYQKPINRTATFSNGPREIKET